MVHLLERHPRLSERPFDRLYMRHCRVRVGIERCTDCAPAGTAASASGHDLRGGVRSGRVHAVLVQGCLQERP
jgi:hypothetical protein